MLAQLSQSLEPRFLNLFILIPLPFFKIYLTSQLASVPNLRLAQVTPATLSTMAMMLTNTLLMLDTVLATVMLTTLFDMATMILTSTQLMLDMVLVTVSYQTSKVHQTLSTTVSIHQVLSAIATA
jgi:hypothetical protein